MSTARNYLTISIASPEEGIRIYRLLRDGLHLSSEKIRSVKFDPEGILLNGSRVTVNTVLHAGDELRILLSDSVMRKDDLVPNPIPLNILYEDRNLLAVDKPAGVVCHPSKGHYLDSLLNGVRAYFDKTDESANIHLIGRLDKDTSGIVLIAKNSVYADALQRLRSTEQYTKMYLALAEGSFAEKCGEICLPMAEYRDPETGILKMIPEKRNDKTVFPARCAQTFYEVLSETVHFSFLRVRIRTGRMHQIRFHMAESGHPLLGDALYGNGPGLIGRTALHASQICFTDPLTSEERCITAPFPDDMLQIIKEMES